MATAASGHVLDYIAGIGQPRHARMEASDPTLSAEVADDGWAFLKRGVALVWVLESEVSRASMGLRSLVAGHCRTSGVRFLH